MKSENIIKYKSTSTNKVASVFAVVWLMYVMNTVIAWYPFPFNTIVMLIGTIGVISMTLVMTRHEVDTKRQVIISLTILYCIIEVALRGSTRVVISLVYTFIPFMCILLWPVNALRSTYALFRKVVLFFALGSSVIVILYYLGILSMIPSYELFPKSYLHSNRGDVYNVYIVFPELVSAIGLFYRRACGFCLEPGHFSIVLGFVYLIDRFMQKRINPLIIIAGILAFSPAFFLTVLFTEFLNLRRYLKRIVISASVFMVSVYAVYSLLPRDIQEIVYYVVYERNVESLFGAYNESGSLTDALDERTNMLGQEAYAKMKFEDRLVGGKGDKDIVLSDYRGFIVAKGILCLSVVILISIIASSGSGYSLMFSLIMTLFMVIVHRAWFFYEPFPYLMAFIATSLCARSNQFLKNRGIINKRITSNGIS